MLDGGAIWVGAPFLQVAEIFSELGLRNLCPGSLYVLAASIHQRLLVALHECMGPVYTGKIILELWYCAATFWQIGLGQQAEVCVVEWETPLTNCLHVLHKLLFLRIVEDGRMSNQTRIFVFTFIAEHSYRNVVLHASLAQWLFSWLH